MVKNSDRRSESYNARKPWKLNASKAVEKPGSHERADERKRPNRSERVIGKKNPKDFKAKPCSLRNPIDESEPTRARKPRRASEPIEREKPAKLEREGRNHELFTIPS